MMGKERGEEKRIAGKVERKNKGDREKEIGRVRNSKREEKRERERGERKKS